MSIWFDLIDPVTKDTIEVLEKHFITVATIEIGGSNSLELNVTYNYSKIINDKFDEALTDLGFILDENLSYEYWLQNKTGAETIPVLKATIEKLGNDVDDDYWKATEGNSKRALCGLLAFAQMRPDGIWDVC